MIDFGKVALKVKGNAWRLVFRIIDARDLVEILAIASHDDAYSSAENRLKPQIFFIVCKENGFYFPNPSFC